MLVGLLLVGVRIQSEKDALKRKNELHRFEIQLLGMELGYASKLIPPEDFKGFHKFWTSNHVLYLSAKDFYGEG